MPHRARPVLCRRTEPKALGPARPAVALDYLNGGGNGQFTAGTGACRCCVNRAGGTDRDQHALWPVETFCFRGTMDPASVRTLRTVTAVVLVSTVFGPCAKV